MTSSDLGSRVHLSGAWTRVVVEAFDALGLDTDALCVQAGSDRAQLTDLSARIPRDVAGRLWRAAADATEDRFVGLHAGAAVHREPDHMFEFLFLKGATFADGIRAGLRFQELVAHGKVVTLHEEDAVKRLRINKVEGELPITHHEIEFIASTMMNYFVMATDGAFRLEKVTFAHPYRGMIEEYEGIFRCPVLFAELHTELWIPTKVWELELAAGDPEQQQRLAVTAEELHRKVELPAFLHSVSRGIGAALPDGLADVETVAHRLHLSARTLQRRLRDEGTTFRALLDLTRRGIVIEGLENKRTAAEIARRAGFANTRGLTRAIRRWRTEKR